ncbi:MAG: hydrogenase formation protein HypD [Burkholderiaceae bacterium]
MSLTKAKARGGDIRMVYSAGDALQLARDNPDRQVVFFAIGFETTTPPTALVIRDAAREGLKNFSVMCSHVLTPPAIRAILDGASEEEFRRPRSKASSAQPISIIIGSDPYAKFAQEYRKPVVIAGFEPLDVLQAILMLVRQVNDGRAEVENEFLRAVTPQGNLNAQALMDEIFELREAFEWRGLGTMPLSALRIRDKYQAYDAEHRFGLVYKAVPDNKACECGAILRGVKEPKDCRSSAPSAPRKTRSVPAWCPAKAPALRITPTAASATHSRPPCAASRLPLLACGGRGTAPDARRSRFLGATGWRSRGSGKLT